ncbi:hypothetical protein LIER_23713 [Lithospermum erythrorhizon]|uniref:Uncharacterized protein n=1 Tax=Lithospermum erythrorhizon TaxID=34254 RepID=A0AAV3R006_LITER
MLENIHKDHETLMFSATMPKWILVLTNKFLKNLLHIDLVGDDDQKLAEGISLLSIASDPRQKLRIFYYSQLEDLAVLSSGCSFGLDFVHAGGFGDRNNSSWSGEFGSSFGSSSGSSDFQEV